MKTGWLRPIDNAALILFRIFFGLLLFLETVGAIFTGWVKANFIDPEFTFSYIGMEWLQPLPGDWMYCYFALMGLMGLFVMLGFKYRFSLGLFTILWTLSYWMQKSSYNNHYYLLILVCLSMLFLPANRDKSIDAKQHPSLQSTLMPQWCSWVLIAQISIVYFFAVLSKLYPGWLDGTFTRIMLQSSSFYNEFETLFSRHWFHLFLAWTGIAFDLLVVPLLLWRRTRTIALLASAVFHLFNAIFLQIGIFPFFALSFVVFFYPPAKIRRWFFGKRNTVITATPYSPQKFLLFWVFIPFFVIQLILPLRHYFIKGDVLWTEEGHRMSWRMMLRQRAGNTNFKVVDMQTNQVLPYDYRSRLTAKQLAFVHSKPDGIWQMAQRISAEFEQKGIAVAVYADSRVSVNEGPYQTFIDPAVDLAKAKWDPLYHNEWVLCYDRYGNLIP